MKLDEKLAADTHEIGRLDDSTVLLHRNATVPWFILVPHTEETELLALPADFRNRLLGESARVAEFVQDYFDVSKINFAAMGNIVPQLHLHVVGRDPRDCCWPNPIWGHLVEYLDYTDAEVAALVTAMAGSCGLQPAQ